MKPPAPVFPLIFSYTRAQALADGALVDASTMAREAGIRFPVTLTAAAWGEAVTMTPAAKQAGCDEVGRLRDVLWMLRCAMGRAPLGSDIVRFPVLVVVGKVEVRSVGLVARIGPGDMGEPIITIMLPGED